MHHFIQYFDYYGVNCNNNNNIEGVLYKKINNLT